MRRAVYKQNAYDVGRDMLGAQRDDYPVVCIATPWWHDAAIIIGAFASVATLLKLAKKK